MSMCAILLTKNIPFRMHSKMQPGQAENIARKRSQSLAYWPWWRRCASRFHCSPTHRGCREQPVGDDWWWKRSWTSYARAWPRPHGLLANGSSSCWLSLYILCCGWGAMSMDGEERLCVVASLFLCSPHRQSLFCHSGQVDVKQTHYYRSEENDAHGAA